MHRVGFVVLLALLVSTCSSNPKASSNSVDVFAAASLTAAFTEAGEAYEAANDDVTVTNSFAGSQALVTQIENGAPADVVATADAEHMQTLVDADLVDAPQVFAENKLQIAVEPGNPKNIRSLADLEGEGVILVLADASVPAGAYAREAFAKAGLPAPEPKSNELDVKATLAKLTSGEADAVVVYVTDVTAAGAKVEGVAIPDEHNVIATYPIAVVKSSKNKRGAQGYIDAIVSGDGQRILNDKGFLPPS